MAASINLVATTAEQQAFELGSKLLELLNADKTANPQADRKSFNVAQNIDLNRLRATYTITLPIVKTATTDGGFEVDTEEVLA